MSDTEREEELEDAFENTKPIMEMGSSLADAAITHVARKNGRTPEKQLERMGDHYAYLAVEQDLDQKQLDDYELTGNSVEVVQ